MTRGAKWLTGPAGRLLEVLNADAGRLRAAAQPEEVEWIEADELWTYVGQKKRPAGCGGLLIVLPRKSAGGRWGIVEPKRPAAWMRSFLTANTSPSVLTSGTPTA